MDSKVFPVQFLILLHKHDIPIPVLDEKLNHIVQQLLPFPHVLNILLLDFIKKILLSKTFKSTYKPWKYIEYSSIHDYFFSDKK